jgi:hypothetical protein
MARNRNNNNNKPKPTGSNTTSNSILQDYLANQDPDSAFLSRLGGAGLNGAFGPTGYSDWLRNDAAGMVDALYGMAIQSNPNLTRNAFLNEFFGNANNINSLSPSGYAPFNAQDNPRDYYNMRMQEAGKNPYGNGPMSKWYATKGYDNAATAYGIAHQQNPMATWYGHVGAGSFQ